MVKIAVVGPIPYDHIETYQGLVKEQYGCILYPTLALALLLPSPSLIYPVANVGEEDKPILERLLSLYSAIDLKGLKATAEGTNKIFLKYVSESERLEKQTNKMKPITFNDLKPFVKSDFFIFVPVTDFEVSLETMENLRKVSKSKIFFDGHGPVNTIDVEGNRTLQPWKDIDRWLLCIDILKMNETEAEFAAGKKLKNKSDFVSVAKEWIDRGPQQVVITLGELGALTVYMYDSEKYWALISAAPVERVVDTTGAGDSFAAGYVYGLLSCNDPLMATMFGNVVAAQKLGAVGPYGYKSQAETEMQVIFNYTPLLRKIQKGWKGKKI